jgi:hypothetical protein
MDAYFSKMEIEPVKSRFFYLSLIFGTLVGLSLSVSRIAIKIVMSHFRFPPPVLCADIAFCNVLIFFPICLYDLVFLKSNVFLADFGLYTLAIISALVGQTFSTMAIEQGKESTASSLESLKVAWQVIILAIASRGQMMPSAWSCIGLLCGLIGSILTLRR